MIPLVEWSFKNFYYGNTIGYIRDRYASGHEVIPQSLWMGV